MAMLPEAAGGNRRRSGARRGALLAVLAMAIPLLAGCGRGSARTERLLDPANELPFGHVDTPVEGTQVPTSVMVAGWALDDRGIREVRVYVDGYIATTTQLNTDRPDVSKVFAQYARGSHLHGWSTSIAFETPGPHTIVVQAVDTDGATRDIGTLAVTVASQ